ncbi:hypothetical protein Dsin_032512 [Dipteronia sinensis]|uniref:protein-serine/threonine phosphatase n=1 Tax=Dipteronia sinensis TaxID=43782 RepID=A0AAE0DQM9_9ROSI|nr:hypothetical protein Dsin_032512 [Dipteronia sinensis]
MEVCQRMLSDEEKEFQDRCRERRRQRIQVRRLASTGSMSSTSRTRKEKLPSVEEGKRIRTAPETSVMHTKTPYFSAYYGEGRGLTLRALAAAPPSESEDPEPVFGSMSVSGRARDMEDAITIQPSLCRPVINRRQPVHFLAVYDGHGGSHVSTLCKEKMHVFIEEELKRVICTSKSESAAGGIRSRQERLKRKQIATVMEGEEEWRRAMVRSFQRMDEMALTTCACGNLGKGCVCPSLELALGGSTAVVAVLTAHHIIVANCGDSRAVLCRGGRAVPLSHDHKPDRPDELQRIQAAGGRVINLDGPRVEGILAMSRAIGDRYLKPVVTAEPEISFTERDPEDECLIIASDGLWDVISSELACEMACECLREGHSDALATIDLNGSPQREEEGIGAMYPTKGLMATALLTRLALGRQSSDNISVIVVCQIMLNDDDDNDLQQKSRECRRVSSTGSKPSTSHTRKENQPGKLPCAVEPVIGCISVAGRAREMEDTVSVRTSLCRPDITRQQPVHFLAVYDGHGGPHAAELCKERMHVFLEEELMRVSGTESKKRKQNDAVELEDMWRTAMVRSFLRMDELALTTCVCGSVDDDCECRSLQVALTGTTAVVAVLTDQHIVVADCGDSRAVLCRGGSAVLVSHNQMPDRPDELRRIEAAGGRIIFQDRPRVEGILAMSRVIGDGYFKPAILTAVPEISFMERDPEDECLILATDGLWDTMSNQLACDMANECLKGGDREALAAIDPNAGPQIEDEGTNGALYPSRGVMAAKLLTRLALGPESFNNISVIVVDLKSS